MASTVTSQEVIHHGWVNVNYDNNLQSDQTYIIETDKDLGVVAKFIGLIGTDLGGVKSSVDLNERNLILIRAPKRAAYNGVKEITSHQTGIQIVTCAFTSHRAGSFSTCANSTLLFVLSAPKQVKEVSVMFQKITVLDEPEFKELNYKETMSSLEKERGEYVTAVDSNICILNEKSDFGTPLDKQSWYAELTPELKTLAAKKWQVQQKIVDLDDLARQSFITVGARYQKTYLGK